MNSTKNVYCDYCDALEGAEYYRDYYSNYYVEYYAHYYAYYYSKVRQSALSIDIDLALSNALLSTGSIVSSTVSVYSPLSHSSSHAPDLLSANTLTTRSAACAFAAAIASPVLPKVLSQEGG